VQRDHSIVVPVNFAGKAGVRQQAKNATEASEFVHKAATDEA
jgi:hypothetical protein